MSRERKWRNSEVVAMFESRDRRLRTEAVRAIAYRPEPGDVLFLEVPGDLSVEEAVELKTHMELIAPGVQVAVLTGGVKVSVAHDGPPPPPPAPPNHGDVVGGRPWGKRVDL